MASIATTTQAAWIRARGKAFQYQTLAPFVITLNSATTYSASYNGTPWSGTYSGTIDGIRVFNDRAGDGSDVFFNNLAIVPEPSCARWRCSLDCASCRVGGRDGNSLRVAS